MCLLCYVHFILKYNIDAQLRSRTRMSNDVGSFKFEYNVIYIAYNVEVIVQKRVAGIETQKT